MEVIERRRQVYSLLILAQSLIYAVGDVVAKTAYAEHGLYFLLTARYLLASALFLLFAGRQIIGTLRAVSPRVWLPPALCMAFAYLGSNYALTRTAATNMAFLRSLSALLSPLLALIFYRRTYRWRHVALQALVLLGLYLLCAEGGLSAFGPGDVAALASALMIAGSLVFGEQAMQTMDAVSLSAVQTFCSLLLSAACFSLQGAPMEALDVSAFLAVAYLALGCTIAGYLLQNAALRGLSSRTVGMIQCIYPVLTALLSFFFLHETLRPGGIAGAVIILICVFSESFMQE